MGNISKNSQQHEPKGGSIDGFLRPARPLNRSAHLTRPAANRLRLQQHTGLPQAPPVSHLRPSNPSYNPSTPPISNTPGMVAPALTSMGTKRRRRAERKKKIAWRRIAAGGVAVVYLALVLSGGWIGWKFLRDTSKVFGGSFASNIGDLLSSTRIKGEAQGRVNILLAGDSSDDPGHQGADLTDSIMVVSIDLKNNTAFLLSIPRDLWVNVPTLGPQKINAANDVTSFHANGYPKGGMGQLEQIVQQTLGIPIDYYALIDYTAFRDAVNAVGGIKITINSPDRYGLYDPNTDLRLPNGVVTLNGKTALNLARSRGDGYGSYGFPQADFDRTQHQRQMLVALKTKASTLGVITNPLKIGQLFDAIGNNVKTDLNLADLLRLIQLTKGIGNSAIQSLTYSESGTNPLLQGYLSPNGQEALIPTAGLGDFSQIKLYYRQLTSTNPVIREAATVVVLNGTETNGLARTAESNLIAKGVDVTSIADATTTYPTTTIINNSKSQKPATLSLLKSIYGNNVTTKQLETLPSNPDYIVILGNNSITKSP